MKKRVLIVEDIEDLRKILRTFLEEEGFEVYEASNCADALKICANFQPHILILDVYLQGELGIDIAATVARDRSYYGSPKVIAVSGTIGGAWVQSEEFMKENNIDVFMKKPINYIDLMATVKSLLNSQF
ncbi:MAG: two-component system regulatory protein, OmpR family [uncultured bacterium]|nr:MAG: two-component system regulatory protein, OmpR family [uncultured bacterium]